MVTDLNNTGKRKRIYSKHKITTKEIDKILLSEIGTHNILRRYPDSDSPYLPPKYTSKMSTLQSSEKTHPNNNNDIKTPQISHDYDALVQNVIASPESPAKVFKNLTPPNWENKYLNKIKHAAKVHKIDN